MLHPRYLAAVSSGLRLCYVTSSPCRGTHFQENRTEGLCDYKASVWAVKNGFYRPTAKSILLKILKSFLSGSSIILRY